MALRWAQVGQKQHFGLEPNITFINPPQSPKMMDACISCKKQIVNQLASTRFDCPSCGKVKLVRCGNCRKIVAKYTCPQCAFTGPN